MKTVLITGVLGYIGSATAIYFASQGVNVVGVDDYSNSDESQIEKIKNSIKNLPENSSHGSFEFIFGDCRNFNAISTSLGNNKKIDCIVHLAGKKYISESLENPYLYFDVNLNLTTGIIELMRIMGISKIIFSSSCTVYGDNENLPYTDRSEIGRALSPYALTKQISEMIIDERCLNDEICAISLRYFNPAGCAYGMRENPKQNRQLFPYIIDCISRNRRIELRGKDYDTPDGSPIRDYIHVEDLAMAHYLAFKKILDMDRHQHLKVNVGSGSGFSVKQIISTFEQELNRKLDYVFLERREGDAAVSYCDITDAKRILNFQSAHVLRDIIHSALEAR